MERPICLMLDRPDIWRALLRACAKTGKSMAARMAIIAITTRSSIKVNALLCTFEYLLITLSYLHSSLRLRLIPIPHQFSPTKTDESGQGQQSTATSAGRFDLGRDTRLRKPETLGIKERLSYLMPSS